MDVLCFDIGSGGARAARFDERLVTAGVSEAAWSLHRDAAGGATLSADEIAGAVEQLARRLGGGGPPAAVCIGCFMHSFLVMSSCCAPLGPVYTWLDSTSTEGVENLRRQFGPRFHAETGCHYHPMFPVFKLAANPPGRGNRVASPKAYLVQELSGSYTDDIGMASASGLLDLGSGRWHPELLRVAGLEVGDLPALSSPYDMVGSVSSDASTRWGVPAGTPLVSGSGDGFLANVGSGCTGPERLAVTLGTSGVVRQMVAAVTPDAQAGTFCYRATPDALLLGCAGSNGGNALDWARTMFGPAGPGAEDLPVFLPWLNGERSLEWNPDLRASFHGLNSRHTAAGLSRAVAEGVIFNLAQYAEVIQRQSGVTARQAVLSGSGFADPQLAPILAALMPAEVLLPAAAGLATLRGAAVYAWRALGHDAGPALERLLQEAERVGFKPEAALRGRFEKFKALRALCKGAG
jgi:gluconokinase